MPVIFSNAHVASCYAVRRMAKRVLNLVRMPASKSIVRLKVESKTRQSNMEVMGHTGGSEPVFFYVFVFE